MADMELFGAQHPQQMPAGNGTSDGGEEDPAAAFLAQQENEIAGIENDEGFGILENGEVPEALQGPEGLGAGTACGAGAGGGGSRLPLSGGAGPGDPARALSRAGPAARGCPGAGRGRPGGPVPQGEPSPCSPGYRLCPPKVPKVCPCANASGADLL